jgi:hypothetical protein
MSDVITIQKNGPDGPSIELTPAQWASHREYLEKEGWADRDEPKRKAKKGKPDEQPTDE